MKNVFSHQEIELGTLTDPSDYLLMTYLKAFIKHISMFNMN